VTHANDTTEPQTSAIIVIMSGIDDGSIISVNDIDNGDVQDGHWVLTLGRKEENDVCLKSDTFVSRQHAKLHLKDHSWWLEDCDSTNGTFIEMPDDFFSDQRVTGIIPLEMDQLFRVGRTWLRLKGL